MVVLCRVLFCRGRLKKESDHVKYSAIVDNKAGQI